MRIHCGEQTVNFSSTNPKTSTSKVWHSYYTPTRITYLVSVDCHGGHSCCRLSYILLVAGLTVCDSRGNRRWSTLQGKEDTYIIITRGSSSLTRNSRVHRCKLILCHILSMCDATISKQRPVEFKILYSSVFAFNSYSYLNKYTLQCNNKTHL